MNELILTRALLNAEGKKYLMLNCTDEDFPRINKLLPDLESSTVIPLAKEGWCAVHTVIEQKDFFDLIAPLKEAGASSIVLLDIHMFVR